MSITVKERQERMRRLGLDPDRIHFRVYDDEIRPVRDKTFGEVLDELNERLKERFGEGKVVLDFAQSSLERRRNSPFPRYVQISAYERLWVSGWYEVIVHAIDWRFRDVDLFYAGEVESRELASDAAQFIFEIFGYRNL